MENELTKTLANFTTDKKFAVGNDLVFIPDFEKSLTELFKKKVYTQNELNYCDQFSNSLKRYASTWAAKEAVYKALKQLDPAICGWKKIEIIRDKTGGRPGVLIHKQNAEVKVSLSISHDGDYAWAIAIIDNTI